MIKKTTVKTRSATTGGEAVKNIMESRFMTLRNLTPAQLTNYVELFESGDFYWLATVMRQMQNRDDIWKIAAAKTRKAVSGRRWLVVPLEGYESDPQAEEQVKELTRFYSRLRMVDYSCRNIRHGIRALIESVMRCYNDGFSVHELVFTPDLSTQDLYCEVISCPLELFRLQGSQLCLRNDGASVPLEPGGWLAVKGDGVGVACCVAKMFKTISLSDWLVYSGRCGHPGIHGKTSAQKGTQQWSDFREALSKFGKEWAAVTGLNDVIEKIDLSVSGTLPYPAMVERMDRAIASLQRGADLSTMSAGSGAGDGASLQGDESDLITSDNCATITDAFRAQIDPLVIAWRFGDGTEVKAGFKLEPPQVDTVDRDLKIDTFLRDSGVKASKQEALSRYQRREADPTDEEDGPLTAPAVAGMLTAASAPAAAAAQAPAVAADAAASVADTALNGAQIASLIELLSSAASKPIPMASLLPILKASFPTIPDETLTAIVTPLQGFTPTVLPNEDGAPDATPLQNDGNPLQNARKGKPRTKTGGGTPPSSEAILEALAVKAEEEAYGALLDAAVEATKKGKKQ